MKVINESGLLVDNSTTPPTCCGYIFNFSGHGAFAPSGKVQLQNGAVRDLTQSEIDTHNRLLGQAEIEALKKHGRGLLYWHRETVGKHPCQYVKNFVGIWASRDGERIEVNHVRTSFHNMAGKQGRRDLWFNFDGSRWHGVNIGDNDIVRIKRCKH